MGIPIPQPAGDIPTYLIFTGIQSVPLPGGPWPDPVDGYYPITLQPNGFYEGETDVYLWRLSVDDGRWRIDAYAKPQFMPIFYGFTYDLASIEADNELAGSQVAYIGGRAYIGYDPLPTFLAAEILQIPTGPKTFYEPMPAAVGHDSYRYARHADGTRIYLRMEKSE